MTIISLPFAAIKIVADLSGRCFNRGPKGRKTVLDSQSHMHRQVRFQSQLEKRRKYRTWVQVFQLSMLFFFADQITKTYCASRLVEGEQRPLLGQSLLKLSRIPDVGILGRAARKLPSEWDAAPRNLALVVWLGIFGLLLLRVNRAKFGELLAFGALLSGAFSNLISRTFSARIFDTFVLQLGQNHFLAFNFADLCVLFGSFFVVRSYLLRWQFGWMRTSRHPF